MTSETRKRMLLDPFMAELEKLSPRLVDLVVLRPALPCDEACFEIRVAGQYRLKIDRTRDGAYRVDVGALASPMQAALAASSAVNACGGDVSLTALVPAAAPMKQESKAML